MRGKRVKKCVQKLLSGMLCIGILTLALSWESRADGKASVVQSVLKGENICLFIRGLGAYESVTGQIGREPVEVVQSGPVDTGHTIILIDNSMSITGDKLEQAKEIIKQYIEKKPEKETVSLAVFGTDIQYLASQETDGGKLTEALDAIVNEDKHTYLTDVLYDELQTLENKTEYTRFLIVTDGVDTKEIGYTKEELSDYLKTHPYPVYSIGCKGTDNEEQLKNLFAISRLTNGEYYLLDDYETYEEIVDGICEPVVCAEISVPDECKDGSIKNILLTFDGPEGQTEISQELSMPFRLREETTTSAPAQTRAPETEPVSVPETEPAVTQESAEEAPAQETGVDFVSIAAVVIIIAALVALVVSRKKKSGGKTKEKEQKKTGRKNKKQTVEQPEGDEENTVAAVSVPEEEATVFVGNQDRAVYIVVLRDCQDREKVFRYPLSNGVVTIGRKHENGVNIVLNYEGTISAKHCEISRRGDRFFVKDLNSTNGTFINEEKVEGTMELIPGSTLRLGDLRLIVEVESGRKMGSS